MVLPSPSFKFLQGALLYICFKITSTGELLHDDNYDDDDDDSDDQNQPDAIVGITHAAVWAACCSFISHNTDAELRPSAQGVLQVSSR